jgi:hypothetical protein
MHVKYLEKAFNCFKGPLEQALTTKRVHATLNVIFGFFFPTNPFQKNHDTFVEDLMFFVIKGFMPLKNVKSIWKH